MECFDNNCTYKKPHTHIHTANGSYVKYTIAPCRHGVKGYCEKCSESNKQISDEEY